MNDIKGFLSTPEGKRLLELLTAGNPTGEIRSAADKAARGDNSGILDLVTRLASTPEGQTLLRRISGANGGAGNDGTRRR